MATISKHKNGTRRIQFCSPNGSRQTIYLGKCPQKVAESIKVKVEALIAAAVANQAVDPETAKWLSNIEVKLANKLAAVGLTGQRQDETLG